MFTFTSGLGKFSPAQESSIPPSQASDRAGRAQRTVCLRLPIHKGETASGTFDVIST